MKSEKLISSGALHFRAQASDICQPSHSISNTKITTSHADLKPSVIPALLPYWPSFISYYFQPIFSGSVLFSSFLLSSDSAIYRIKPCIQKSKYDVGESQKRFWWDGFSQLISIKKQGSVPTQKTAMYTTSLTLCPAPCNHLCSQRQVNMVTGNALQVTILSNQDPCL